MNTSAEGFKENFKYLTGTVPGNPLMIGRYGLTHGVFRDAQRCLGEIFFNTDSGHVLGTKQFFNTNSNMIEQINQEGREVKWCHLAHSEGGILTDRAIQRMTSQQQQNLKNYFIYVGIAPGLPLDMNCALDSINIYSKRDYIVLGFAHPEWNLVNLVYSNPGLDVAARHLGIKKDRQCNLRFVPCISTKEELTGGFADHAFLGSTYRKATSDAIRDIERDYGFYK